MQADNKNCAGLNWCLCSGKLLDHEAVARPKFKAGLARRFAVEMGTPWACNNPYLEAGKRFFLYFSASPLIGHKVCHTWQEPRRTHRFSPARKVQPVIAWWKLLGYSSNRALNLASFSTD